MNQKFDIKAELKSKHQLIPLKSKMLITPTFQDFSVGLKQYYTYELTRRLYNYLFSVDGQDSTIVLQTQRELEQNILPMMARIQTELGIQGRSTLFSVLIDYSDIWALNRVIPPASSDKDKATLALLLLCMMSISELITLTDSITLPIDKLVSEIPSNPLINKGKAAQNLNFGQNFFNILDYSSENLFDLEYTEMVGNAMLSDDLLLLIRAGLISYSSRRGALTRSNQRAMIFMSPLEISAAMRSVLSIVVNHYSDMHIKLIDIKSGYVQKNKGVVASYLLYLNQFYEKLLDVKGIIDVMKFRDAINTLNPAPITGMEPDEVVDLIREIVLVLKDYKTTKSTDYVAKIENLVLSQLRYEWYLSTQKDIISQMVQLNVEKVDVNKEQADFVKPPVKWFETTPINWYDLVKIKNRTRLNITRVDSTSTTDTFIHSIMSEPHDLLPMNVITTEHTPKILQLDYLSRDGDVLQLTPLSEIPIMPTGQITKVVVDKVISDLRSIADIRKMLYTTTIEDEITDDDIRGDLKFIAKIEDITASPITADLSKSNIEKEDIIIFDINLAKVMIPIVIPINKMTISYSQYEELYSTDMYKVILVPDSEVSSVTGYNFLDYMSNRVDDVALPSVSLSYNPEIIKTQTYWRPTLEFSAISRIESQLLADFSVPFRSITKNRIYVSRLSVDEVIKRIQFRKIVKFLQDIEKAGSKILRYKNFFADFYNTLYTVGTGYHNVDTIIRTFGQYTSHEIFAIRKPIKEINIIVELVSFMLMRYIFSEQAVITFLPIPKILDPMGHSSEIKNLVKDWFQNPEDMKITQPDITSMFDFTRSHMMKVIAEVANRKIDIKE